MSLDDESPTQYFGPGAQVWDSPEGRTLQLSPAGARHNGARLTQAGWTRSEKEPIAIHTDTCMALPVDECICAEEVPELANPDVTEPLHHRVGCSHSRTGRCICSYLAQWDKYPGYTAPAFKLTPRDIEGNPLAVEEELDPELKQLHEGALRVQGQLGIESDQIVDSNAALIRDANEALRAASNTIHAQSAAYRELNDHLRHVMRVDRVAIIGLTVSAIGGWALVIARGIWGF